MEAQYALVQQKRIIKDIFINMKDKIFLHHKLWNFL